MRPLCLAVAALAALGACGGPSARDKAFAQMFWVAPGDVLALTHVPAGIEVDGPPRLVMTLQDASGAPPRVRSFTMMGSGDGMWRLRPGDYGRFLAMQERVVASIGAQASVAVMLQVAYCARPDTAPGRGAPTAEVTDRSTGTLMMRAPAETDAARLHSTLPRCG